jgi:hypothetical protein
LGPGGSIGTGLAAILSGVSHYNALDIVEHANTEENLRILDELVQLFRHRAAPARRNLPELPGNIPDGAFPHQFLSEDLLSWTLSEQRVARLREAVQDYRRGGADVSIRYCAPWSDPAVVAPASIDMVFSQSVLQHVDHLAETYAAMDSWLRPGGYMSHQIDYRSLGLSRSWNGYRDCPEWLWRLARGKGSYLINREPHSYHMGELRRLGYEVLVEIRSNSAHDSIDRKHLAKRWQDISDEDLHCSGVFLQARKPLRADAMTGADHA